MHEQVPLPETLDAISTDWLTGALASSFPGIEVRNLEIVDRRSGFTTVIRIRLDMNGAGREAGAPEYMILKGGFECFTRDLAGDSYAIRPLALEVGSYQELPELGLNMPTCWFARFSETQKQMMIAMEDLTKREATLCHGLGPRPRSRPSVV